MNEFSPILLVFSDKETAVVAIVPDRTKEESADGAAFPASRSSSGASPRGTAEPGSDTRKTNVCRRFLSRSRKPHTARD